MTRTWYEMRRLKRRNCQSDYGEGSGVGQYDGIHDHDMDDGVFA